MNTSITYRYVLEHLTANELPINSIKIALYDGDWTLSFDGEFSSSNLQVICDKWSKIEPERASRVGELLSCIKVELKFERNGSFNTSYTSLVNLTSSDKELVEHFVSAITFYAEQAQESLLLKITQISLSLGSMKNSLEQFEREFKTARYLIRVSECYESEFDVKEWDKEVFLNLVDSLLKHETRVYALKVALFSRDDNREIASSILKGCINSTRSYDLTHSGFMLKVFKKVRENAALSA